MKFQRRPPAQSARSAPPVDLERKRRAEELSTRSGIPLQMAYSVVDGHTSLDAVLKGMLAREKTRRLAEQYGLPPSLAGQVARGQVPLDKVLCPHRRRTSAQWRARFSVFDSLAEQPGKIGLLRFGSDWTEGTVTRRRQIRISIPTAETVPSPCSSMRSSFCCRRPATSRRRGLC
jgi:hypothetical protein